MKPKLITTHVYTKRPNGECVWCDSPRSAHEYEFIRGTEGEPDKRVAIEETK